MSGYIKRFVICNGDSTTVGGRVIGSLKNHTTKGVARAAEGDSVICPSCNSTGIIRSVLPTRQETIDGVLAAVEGDLCVCGCDPSPRLVAGVAKNFHSWDFTPVEMATNPELVAWMMGNGDLSTGFWLDAGLTHDRTIVVRDKSGNPMADITYRLTLESGQVIVGRTDVQGKTQTIYAANTAVAKLEVPFYGNVHSATNPDIGHDSCGCGN